MTLRIWTMGIVAAWLTAPSACFAQAAHADDVQIIKPPEVKPAADEKKPDLAASVKIVVEKTNAFRQKEGKPPVGLNAKLTETAKYFADYMARTDRYGHTADEKQPAERAARHDYEYCIVLENIAYRYQAAGFTTEEMGTTFFTGWRESPGHRKNMLDADVTDTGVAIARSAKTGHYYAVQMFGRPKSKAIEFKITNRASEAVSYRIGDESFTLEPRYGRAHMRCRPAELILEPAAKEGVAKPKTQSVLPVNGDKFVIIQDKGGYRLKKE